MVTITPGARHRRHRHRSSRPSPTCPAGRTGRSASRSPSPSSASPARPAQPTASESSHTLAVSFGTAAPNGAPVEYYTVYANGAPHQCPARPCTITGLANGTEYTVYVTATNSVGAGPAQRRAPPATPNAVPDQVTGLSTAVGDQQVTLTWQPAHVDGTPVTGYDVEISPPPAGQQQISTSGVDHHARVHRAGQRDHVHVQRAGGQRAGQRAVVARGHRGPVRQAADDGRADGHRRAGARPGHHPGDHRSPGRPCRAPPPTAGQSPPTPSTSTSRRRAAARGPRSSTEHRGRRRHHRQLHGDQRQLLVRVHGHRDQPGRRVREVAAVHPGRAGRRAAGRARRPDRDRDRAGQQRSRSASPCPRRTPSRSATSSTASTRSRRPARSPGRSPRAPWRPSPSPAR